MKLDILHLIALVLQPVIIFRFWYVFLIVKWGIICCKMLQKLERVTCLLVF